MVAIASSVSGVARIVDIVKQSALISIFNVMVFISDRVAVVACVNLVIWIMAVPASITETIAPSVI